MQISLGIYSLKSRGSVQCSLKYIHDMMGAAVDGRYMTPKAQKSPPLSVSRRKRTVPGTLKAFLFNTDCNFS